MPRASLSTLIPPHGGTLEERLVEPGLRSELASQAAGMPRLAIDPRALSDVRMLGIGAYSPLRGFMVQEEYERVVGAMRLPSGRVWPIPVTLAVGEAEARQLQGAPKAALVYGDRPVAIIEIADVYRPDKRLEAQCVYGVDDPRHPGVRALLDQGEYYVGGPVHVFDLALDLEGELAPYFLSARETRALFAERGWRTVVAFQTRNPIHRAHEYLQKCALEMVDGLLVHPIAGVTKGDDIDAVTRFACYRALLDGYYPPERVILAAFPASMRYAGPREAVFHALCRQNFGCTHMIVGRDHAGVGSYYGPYDAQKIFERFAPGEIGIQPIPFENAFYCTACQGMATRRTCPHDEVHHVVLSGTKVREMLRGGKRPPAEFTRPEVADILLRSLCREKAGTPAAGGRWA